MNNLSWVQLASLMMFLGVTMGAFGSHALRGKITDYQLEIYKTGVMYQLIHALGLFIVAWLTTQSQDPRVHYAGLCFLVGMFLFSGSLYLLAVTDVKWFGAITPLGGFAFLAGWFLLMHSHYNQIF
jgi:uncharacterized membrane protein YgdD (TMEM256/DUF423 family)